MSAEKKQKTSKLNQTVKLGIRSGLFYFVRVNSLTPGLTEWMCRYNLPQCHSCKVFFLCLLDGDATEKQTVKINCTTYCRSLIPDCFLLSLSTPFLAPPCLERYASPLCFSRAAKGKKKSIPGGKKNEMQIQVSHSDQRKERGQKQLPFVLS